MQKEKIIRNKKCEKSCREEGGKEGAAGREKAGKKNVAEERNWSWRDGSRELEEWRERAGGTESS